MQWSSPACWSSDGLWLLLPPVVSEASVQGNQKDVWIGASLSSWFAIAVLCDGCWFVVGQVPWFVVAKVLFHLLNECLFIAIIL